jgi:hypothetical protein
MEWNRKDMISARPQDTAYLPEPFFGVSDMFEHILGDDKIEGVVSIGQGFDILARSAGRNFRTGSHPVFVIGAETTVIIPQNSAEAIVHGGVVNGEIRRAGQIGN